jgi:hypothetical protein
VVTPFPVDTISGRYFKIQYRIASIGNPNVQLYMLGVALGAPPAEAARAPPEGVVDQVRLTGIAVDAVPVVAGRPGHAVDDKKMTGAVGRGLVAPREGTAVEF